MNLDGVFVESGDENSVFFSSHGNRRLEAKGSYNTLDFVVRLRPDIQKILEDQGGNFSMRECESWDAVQAFSTYLHETIHWWQHVGTSAGLMLSFLQPAHAHMNRRLLNDILLKYGPVKPLLGLADKLLDAGQQDGTINTVLNNWRDLEFFQKIAISPTRTMECVVTDKYFESVGHSYRMAICAASWLIASTVDPNYEALPHPRDWEEAMEVLRQSEVKGFYFGSPVDVPPLGLQEILEGQARFSQLQYLYGGSGGRLSWDNFRNRGMLDGVYVRAFEVFLGFAGEEWPATVDDPVVGLFLLICDVALSPSEGLFFPMRDPSSLIWSTDPGMRFILLCQSAKEEGKLFKRSIQNYSEDEYWQVSQRLSDVILSPSPKQVAEAILQYSETHQAWNKLVEEDRTFKYREENLPIRVLLGRFTRIQVDKIKYPHFFCWPGMCLNSFRPPLDGDAVISLFNEHQALFLDRTDRDVYPRLVPGKDEASLQRLLNDFFVWVSTYEMTRQWLVENGSFDYDYGWLTSKFTKADIKSWVDHNFNISTGIHPDDFSILR